MRLYRNKKERVLRIESEPSFISISDIKDCSSVKNGPAPQDSNHPNIGGMAFGHKFLIALTIALP